MTIALEILLSDGRVDLPRREVHRQSCERLTTLEAALLSYLAQRAPDTVSREELLEEVWGYHAASQTRAIDNTVRRLRTKIEIDARHPQHLLTVHGTGYQFVPAREPALAVEATPPEARVAPGRAFIGRRKELDTTRAHYAAGASLVTLVGPGGVGKTRLARELGPSTFCDLSEARNREEVVACVAAGLGLDLSSADGDRAIETALAARDGVVVIDNAEQVRDAVATLVDGWLTAAPTASLLVTSREPLRLAAEAVVNVAPLPAADAVALFVDRARAIAPEVRGDDAAIAYIVDRVDRLPLAIELASARVGVLSPAEIGARLDRRFDLLRARRSDLPERHQTLWGTLAWSWELMAPWEQAALAQLSVFRGGFGVAAAEAVVDLTDHPGAPWVVDILQGLVDRSLLQRARGEGEDPGPMRFRLLVSVQAFAAAYLDPPDPTYARHWSHFDRSAADRLAALRGPGGRAALAWLGREQSNLLAAHERAQAAAPAVSARLGLALARYLTVRGPVALHESVLDAVVAVVDRQEAPQLRAEAYLARATLRRGIGALPLARHDLSLARSSAPGDDAGHTVAVEILAGHLARHAEGPVAARVHFDAAVATARASRDQHLIADALRALGALQQETHAMRDARSSYVEALSYYRAVEDLPAQAVVLGRLATVEMELDAPADARAHFTEAIAIHHGLGDRRQEAITASNLSVLLHHEGDLDAAERQWRAALALHREVGNRRFAGFALAGLGLVALELGRIVLGAQLARDALVIFRDVSDRRFEAVALARLGAAEALGGHLVEADAALAEARAIFTDERADWGVAGVRWLEQLVDVHRADVTPAAAVALRDAARARHSDRPSSFERLCLRLVTAATAGAA